LIPRTFPTGWLQYVRQLVAERLQDGFKGSVLITSASVATNMLSTTDAAKPICANHEVAATYQLHLAGSVLITSAAFATTAHHRRDAAKPT
jgi:hypothetical protein